MTTLSKLRALVRSPEWQAVDRTAQIVRSIQQSLRAEGYEVDEATVLKEIERSHRRRQMVEEHAASGVEKVWVEIDGEDFYGYEDEESDDS